MGVSVWWAGFFEDVDQEDAEALRRVSQLGIHAMEHSCIQVDETAWWKLEIDGFQLSPGFFVEVTGKQPGGSDILGR